MLQQDLSWMITVGKWMLVTWCLVAGSLNLMPYRVKDRFERMAGLGVSLPATAFWLGIAMGFAGCALVISGWHAHTGVWLLTAFAVIAGGIRHRFWRVDDPMQRPMLRIALLNNNVAVIGGLLLQEVERS